MKSREFTPEEEEAIVAVYAGGASVAQLSSSYKTGWSQIAQVLKARGVYEGAERASLVKRRAEMCERYRAGDSLSALAEAYGCSAAIVLKNLRRGGVTMRPSGTPRPAYVEDIRRLREQGMGSRKIAKELGIGVTTATKWSQRLGMPSESQSLTPTSGNTPTVMRARPGRPRPAYVEDIRRLREQGVSSREIAKELGIAVATAQKWSRWLGMPSERGIPAYVEDIRRLREQGMESREIAKELGIKMGTATKWMRKFGMPAVRGAQTQGSNSPVWKGGVREMGAYIAVWMPRGDPLYSMAWKNGFVPEHRLVMARKLGRPLTRRETVHHLNGDTSDNRPENLQLRHKPHGKGVRLRCRSCGSHDIEEAHL